MYFKHPIVICVVPQIHSPLLDDGNQHLPTANYLMRDCFMLISDTTLCVLLRHFSYIPIRGFRYNFCGLFLSLILSAADSYDPITSSSQLPPVAFLHQLWFPSSKIDTGAIIRRFSI